MHSRGLLQWPAVRHLDAQLSFVDATDQPRQLRSVTADEDSLRGDSAARVLRPENHGAHVEAAVGDCADQGFGLLVGCADEIEHHVERSSLDLDR